MCQSGEASPPRLTGAAAQSGFGFLSTAEFLSLSTVYLYQHLKREHAGEDVVKVTQHLSRRKRGKKWFVKCLVVAWKKQIKKLPKMSFKKNDIKIDEISHCLLHCSSTFVQNVDNRKEQNQTGHTAAASEQIQLSFSVSVTTLWVISSIGLRLM